MLILLEQLLLKEVHHNMRPWKALPRIAQLEIYIDPLILGTLYPFHLVSDFGTKFILEPKMAFMNEKYYLLRVVKKLTSVLIAGFKKFNKNYPNKPTL